MSLPAPACSRCTDRGLIGQKHTTVRALLVPLSTPTVACSRVRIYQYLPFLRERGVTGTVIPFFPRPLPDGAELPRSRVRRAQARLHTLRRGLLIAVLAPRYDLVVLQRVLLPLPIQELLARRARALAFDVDDAIYTSHLTELRATREMRRDAGRFRRLIRRSSAVLASTAYLADRVRLDQPNTAIIPSPVDCDRYRPLDRPAGREVVIGWIGSASTTGYVQALLPVLRRLRTRYPVRVELVGADPRLAPEPGVSRRPWTLGDECARLQQFDVGVMPLPDDEWTRAKAGYKLLQYMACGIPCIASPVGVNRDLVERSRAGLLAGDDAAWEAALLRLIEDTALRRRFGAAGRAFVEREYSLQTWAPRFGTTLCAAAAHGNVAA